MPNGLSGARNLFYGMCGRLGGMLNGLSGACNLFYGMCGQLGGMWNGLSGARNGVRADSFPPPQRRGIKSLP
jgi:hypothetical protein